MPFVISVWNCRATVSRQVDMGNGVWSYEPAANWQDIENAAIDEVEASGGAINMSAIYPCSAELAARAQFA